MDSLDAPRKYGNETTRMLLLAEVFGSRVRVCRDCLSGPAWHTLFDLHGHEI